MVEWPLCAEMVVIHKAVGAQQFAAQLIGRGFLRGGVLDIVSHRISRCIPISFFIQIVGTIRTPQDSGKKLDILQRDFCRKSAWFILLIVYALLGISWPLLTEWLRAPPVRSRWKRDEVLVAGHLARVINRSFLLDL